MNKVYTVTQVNSYIKNLFVSDYALNQIYIKGEVSNCKYHSSGHIYFTLKDPKGAMACVMFAGSRATGLRFTMKDGQSVVAGGSVSVYERDGRYQLYAKDIILDGVGALYEEYERLKQKLYEEGLFDHEYKKPIPKYAQKIGIVTAATGAAIEDIKSIAKRRNPYVQLYLFKAQVQGIGAAQSIVKGIKQLDQMNLDTIIVGRGGGSIEDLWAFNEEIVARAIFHATTPIISGTGHESDTTIADYAADLRAPTPSAACEMAVMDYRLFKEDLITRHRKLNNIIEFKINQVKYKLESRQLKLQYLSPMNQIREKSLHLAELSDRLNGALNHKLQTRKHQLAIYLEKLNGLSPTRKLINGYGYITDEEDKPVMNIEQIKKDNTIQVTLLNGNFKAKVIRVNGRKDDINGKT